MKKKAFIYRITNTKNQLQYVGATTLYPPIKRWQKHLAVARSPKTYATNHTFQKLHQAIREDGPENFLFEVLEEVSPQSKRFAREKHWVKEVGSFGQYNSTLGGKGTPGTPVSEATKQRIRELNRERMLGPDNPMLGKTQSEETKRKIAETRRKTRERKARAKGKNNPFYGQKHSETSKVLMKEAWEEREYKKEWVLARTKLSKEDVLAIREAYKSGTRVKELAEKYDLSISGIYKILRTDRKIDSE